MSNAGDKPVVTQAWLRELLRDKVQFYVSGDATEEDIEKLFDSFTDSDEYDQNVAALVQVPRWISQCEAQRAVDDAFRHREQDTLSREGREALAARLLKNAEWRDERSQCVTDPNLLREAAEALSGGAATAPIASIVVKLSAIRTALREAHWALDDSEDLSHQDPPVHAVPLENVMRLHRALKACERFAPDDAAWQGPGPLVTEIIEWLGTSAALSTPPASPEQTDQADVLRERIVELEELIEHLTQEPLNQDEQGGCVWCGGSSKGRLTATENPKDHSADCPYILSRAALKAQEG